MVHTCSCTVQTRLHSFSTTTSFPIRPNKPCNTSKSQLSAGASPSEQPSKQLGKLRLFLLNNCLNHVHTLHIHVHTVYRHVHTVYRHVHMLYMGTSHFMHVPLWYRPFILVCTASVPPLDNANVQESANVYIHCSYMYIPPKNGSDR